MESAAYAGSGHGRPDRRLFNQQICRAICVVAAARAEQPARSDDRDCADIFPAEGGWPESSLATEALAFLLQANRNHGTAIAPRVHKGRSGAATQFANLAKTEAGAFQPFPLVPPKEARAGSLLTGAET